MFTILRRRLRQEHLELVRQTIMMASKLRSSCELAVTLGIGGPGAVREASAYRSLAEQLDGVLTQFEERPDDVLPDEVAGQLTETLRDLQVRLEVVDSVTRPARSNGRPA